MSEVATRRSVRVLVVEHEPGAPAALLGQWLVDAGAELDVRRPYAGDALPDSLDDHDALLVLGGSMGAHDDADEHVDDLFGIVPGSARIPQRQRRNPVRVDVLRCSLKLSKRG